MFNKKPKFDWKYNKDIEGLPDDRKQCEYIEENGTRCWRVIDKKFQFCYGHFIESKKNSE